MVSVRYSSCQVPFPSCFGGREGLSMEGIMADFERFFNDFIRVCRSGLCRMPAQPGGGQGRAGTVQKDP